MGTITVPISSSLRQILSYSNPQDQQQQQQQQNNSQQMTLTYSQNDSQYSSPAIVRGAEGIFELNAKGQVVFAQESSGQLKQWIISNAPTDASQSSSEISDHCYATGTAASDSGPKLSPLTAALAGKATTVTDMETLRAVTDMETLRALQSCQGVALGTDVTGTATFATQSAVSSSSGLQANWDTALSFSDLGSLQLQEYINPLPVSQTAIITVNVPITGTCDAPTTLTLTQTS